MNILVLGGYGNFGARICRALAGGDGIALQVAGRDLAKAKLLADRLGASACRLDSTASDLARRFRDLGVGLVIHTAGPFQAQHYSVAQAAADAGAHYIDLADGRRFVCDFTDRMDHMFRSAGTCAVSGASTVPALSSAVIDEALPRFSRLDSIDMCIAPAQRAPRGRATLAGVLSYCGESIQVWREGRWQALYGWGQPAQVRFARLKPRLGALCDIPDLELFPLRYAGVQEVMFRAALEVRFTQQLFAAVGWLRRRQLFKEPARLAGLLHGVGGILDPLGTPDGAMVIRLAGSGRAGQPLRLAWHITAGNHDGPEIPCMAAILLARRLARGDGPPAGAHAAAGLVQLRDFAPEFARWGMVTEWQEEA